jgi:hypothetical protein
VVLRAGVSYFAGSRMAASDAASAVPATTVRTTVETVHTTVQSTAPTETVVKTVTAEPITVTATTVDTATTIQTATTTAVRTTTAIVTKSAAASAAGQPSGADGTIPLTTEIGSTRYLITFTIADYDRKGLYSQDYAKGVQTKIDDVLYVYAIQTTADAGTDADMGVYWQEYRINKEWSRFTSVIGVSDDSDSSEPVDFKVFGDGKVLVQGTTRKGDAKKIDVPVKGVTVLRLWVSEPSQITADCCDDPAPTWGDPQLHK